MKVIKTTEAKADAIHGAIKQIHRSKDNLRFMNRSQFDEMVQKACDDFSVDEKHIRKLGGWPAKNDLKTPCHLVQFEIFNTQQLCIA